VTNRSLVEEMARNLDDRIRSEFANYEKRFAELEKHTEEAYRQGCRDGYNLGYAQGKESS
jgi:hypothetical protein